MLSRNVESIEEFGIASRALVFACEQFAPAYEAFKNTQIEQIRHHIRGQAELLTIMNWSSEWNVALINAAKNLGHKPQVDGKGFLHTHAAAVHFWSRILDLVWDYVDAGSLDVDSEGATDSPVESSEADQDYDWSADFTYVISSGAIHYGGIGTGNPQGSREQLYDALTRHGHNPLLHERAAIFLSVDPISRYIAKVKIDPLHFHRSGIETAFGADSDIRLLYMQFPYQLKREMVEAISLFRRENFDSPLVNREWRGTDGTRHDGSVQPKVVKKSSDSSTDSGSGFMGGEELRKALGVHPTQVGAFEQQLSRKRKSLGDANFKEVSDPRPNTPKYLYRVDANSVRELAKPYKTPKKSL